MSLRPLKDYGAPARQHDAAMDWLQAPSCTKARICQDSIILLPLRSVSGVIWLKQLHIALCPGCAADSVRERGQCPVKDLGYGSEGKSIKTVLVFKDPSDWYVDLQVITDICVGG